MNKNGWALSGTKSEFHKNESLERIQRASSVSDNTKFQNNNRHRNRTVTESKILSKGLWKTKGSNSLKRTNRQCPGAGVKLT